MCPCSRKVWKATPFLLTLGTAKGKRNEEVWVGDGERPGSQTVQQGEKGEQDGACGRAEVSGTVWGIRLNGAHSSKLKSKQATRECSAYSTLHTLWTQAGKGKG